MTRHDFVLDERLLADVNRVRCKTCGKHVLGLAAHNRLSRPELDRIATGLHYPTETRAQALRSMGLQRGKAADGTAIWE